jgi:hypothetical protein
LQPSANRPDFCNFQRRLLSGELVLGQGHAGAGGAIVRFRDEFLPVENPSSARPCQWSQNGPEATVSRHFQTFSSPLFLKRARRRPSSG